MKNEELWGLLSLLLYLELLEHKKRMTGPTLDAPETASKFMRDNW